MSALLALLVGCHPSPEPTPPGTPTTTDTNTWSHGYCPEACCYSDPCPELEESLVPHPTLAIDEDLVLSSAYECSVRDRVVVRVDGVTGTTTTDDFGAVFHPDAPLSPGTSYAYQVVGDGVCWTPVCGYSCELDVASTFTTWDVVDTGPSVGTTFAFSWYRWDWTEPWGVDPLPVDQLLLELASVDGQDATLVVASGSHYPPTVDCGTRATWPASLAANPVLRAAGDVKLLAEGTPIELEQVEISARLVEGGAALRDLHLRALAAMELFGTRTCNVNPCVPCASSPSGRCVVLAGDTTYSAAPKSELDLATCD
ncbi:MAG: hypothetical protein H6738_10525 [Alphaproteobacteria bacterium]|nr:hypothetical protein [Alphaproteobacteria bacterium]MCB9697204.1 hypothetical protein [Alphaproteobacteria bacterium]